MTECIEVGVAKGENGQPYWTYRMSAGAAVLIDDDKRTTEEVQVSPAQAKLAKDQNILRFMGGKTVVVFTINDRQYAQRLPVKEGTYVGKAKQAAPQRRPAASRAPRGQSAELAAGHDQSAARPADAMEPAQAGVHSPIRHPVKRREAPRQRAKYEPL